MFIRSTQGSLVNLDLVRRVYVSSLADDDGPWCVIAWGESGPCGELFRGSREESERYLSWLEGQVGLGSPNGVAGRLG